jgi:3-deoxy-D-manno-octulosonic-acid transferase
MSNMAGYLLNLVYLALLVVLSPYFVYAAIRKGKYRAGWQAKFFGLVPRRAGWKSCVWFHAVSVGEVQLLAPVIAEIERRRPRLDIVISTTTRTGFEVATKKYARHTVFYCPLDFTWSTSNAMRRIRPDILVLAELELWPNLIRAARAYGARVAVVNGRLSDRSFRGYRRIRPLVSPLLRSIDLIAVQNENYAERFVALGATPASVRVTGSVKFDGAQSDRSNPRTASLRGLAGIADDDIVFLAGSTQRGEEAMAVEVFRALQDKHEHLRLILVPRHPQRFDEVARMLDQSGLPWQRRSLLDQPVAESSTARILLVDTVGELGAWWGAAKIGFVGGSLGSRGGQNMIEPAAYGAAVCFGPNTQNFRDVVAALLADEAAVVVADQQELTQFVRRCLQDEGYAAELGRRAASLVAASRGATKWSVSLILDLFSKRSDRAVRRPAA